MTALRSFLEQPKNWLTIVLYSVGFWKTIEVAFALQAIEHHWTSIAFFTLLFLAIFICVEVHHEGVPRPKLAAIRIIAETLQSNDAVVATTGMPSRELFSCADRPLNFYMHQQCAIPIENSHSLLRLRQSHAERN